MRGSGAAPNFMLYKLLVCTTVTGPTSSVNATKLQLALLVRQTHFMYDVIIIGGSYAGLSAALALGRSLRKTLVIDAGQAANRFTPHAHNFITHDGRAPEEIRELARSQVQAYGDVSFHTGKATIATGKVDNFSITTDSGAVFTGRRLLLAGGIVDKLPDLPGAQECWGKSYIHCPYCHGYEYKGEKTAILQVGEQTSHYAHTIGNWTDDLTVLSNGADPESLSALPPTTKLRTSGLAQLHHEDGQLTAIEFTDGTQEEFTVLYNSPAFRLSSDLSHQLNCEHQDSGRITIDDTMHTSVPGVFAAGDCTTMFR